MGTCCSVADADEVRQEGGKQPDMDDTRGYAPWGHASLSGGGGGYYKGILLLTIILISDDT
jgi:hypothetical protein